uniref:MULE transposase domain-containing protein n=1 Tax=Arundo donax TaxID=35708 RepID=A0A0A9HMU8_ARUDO
MKESDLERCELVIGELPHPRSMSLVDLQCWIIKLFRLHPETQDFEIRGFFAEDCPLVSDPWELYLYWQYHYLMTDDLWASYVKKVKGRNGMAMFVLYVDCSEIRHYKSFLEAGYNAHSQVAMGANVQCTLTKVLPEQNSLSCNWHAFRISDHLEQNLAITTTEIVASLAERCGEQITRARAWRVKQKALEMEFGTFYDSYNHVMRLLKDIRGRPNGPDHFIDTNDTEIAGCKDFRVLHRIFWAFAQCIKAFVSCRPVLCIKSTSLCGKYQGVLLTALALDANDDYIPVAFAIVEGESKESWLWFLRNVKRGVVKQRCHVCIIHDYRKELLDAIEDLQNNQQEAHSWRDVKSWWCMQHLAENFLAHFGDEKLVMLFKKLCQQNQLSKFVKIWKELDELTSKYAAEKEGATSLEMQQESVGHMTELQPQSPVQDKEEGNDSGDSNSNRIRLLFSEWIGDEINGEVVATA